VFSANHRRVVRRRTIRRKQRYEDAGRGDLVTLIVAKGQGHSFWEGFFHCQELVDFLIDRARDGAGNTR